jgi:serine/threonine protein kinase
LIGQTLAHYRITAAIGAGGMGEVYRATDTKLGREVALKVLPAETAARAERLARFQREARAVAALNHPHIVTIHSVEEADGVHFLTMELVDGEPLDRLIPGSGLPVGRIREIAAALASALEAAHPRLAELPIVMIGTYRDVEADVGEPFARSMATLVRQRLAERMTVKAFAALAASASA